MLQFFLLQITLLFCFVTPEKVENLEKLLNSHSVGDKPSLLQILWQFNLNVINDQIYVLGETQILIKLKH